MSGVLAPTRQQMDELRGTAWATSRLLDVTFTESCWARLSDTITTAMEAKPPQGDDAAIGADPQQLERLAHARIIRLMLLMYEQALQQPPDHTGHLQLTELCLIVALTRKLCLWPFWLEGC